MSNHPLFTWECHTEDSVAAHTLIGRTGGVLCAGGADRSSVRGGKQ